MTTVTNCLGVLQFYILRKLIEHELGEQKVGEDDCYICSLSSRILVYKGQLTPGQVTAAVIEGFVVDSIDYFTEVPTLSAEYCSAYCPASMPASLHIANAKPTLRCCCQKWPYRC